MPDTGGRHYSNLSFDEDTVTPKNQRGGTTAARKKGANSITDIAPHRRLTVRIKACEPRTLGKHLPPSVAIIGTLGPAPISVITGYEDVHAVLMSGEERPILV
jgi:hypothetical protein